MAQNSTEFSAIPGLDGVTVVRHSGPPPTDARHRHDSLCLGAVLAGERAVIVDGIEHAASAGEVLVIGPGQVHACPNRGESRYVMIAVSPDRLTRLGLTPIRPACPVLDDPVLFGRITGLADLADAPGSPLEREGALLALLTLLCEEGEFSPADQPEEERIRTVTTRLESSFADDLRLDDLAEEAGCSPCRLNRIFAAASGMPPHEYQSMLRIREVKRLIREGASLADAAMAAGFCDQSHMTRCFKRLMGMTPGTFAAGLRP